MDIRTDKVENIKITDIVIPKWHRDLDPLKVETLKESINEVGLLQPIVVTTNNFLVAGQYRINAFTALGRESIPAYIKECSDIDAEISCIDENIVRNDLTALEFTTQLARRKKLFEEKHVGETRIPGKFLDETAEKTGKSNTTIFSDLELGQLLEDKLPSDVRKKVIQTKVADNKAQLEELANTHYDDQVKIVDAILAYETEENKPEKNQRFYQTLSVKDAKERLGITDKGLTHDGDGGTPASKYLKLLAKLDKICQEFVDQGNLKSLLGIWTDEMKIDARENTQNIRNYMDKIADEITEDLDSRYH